MTRFHLGRWRCPSGNGVDVYAVRGAGDAPRLLSLSAEWDHYPPTRRDAGHWRRCVLPEVTQAAADVTGLCVLMVSL